MSNCPLNASLQSSQESAAFTELFDWGCRADVCPLMFFQHGLLAIVVINHEYIGWLGTRLPVCRALCIIAIHSWTTHSAGHSWASCNIMSHEPLLTAIDLKKLSCTNRERQLISVHPPQLGQTRARSASCRCPLPPPVPHHPSPRHHCGHDCGPALAYWDKHQPPPESGIPRTLGSRQSQPHGMPPYACYSGFCAGLFRCVSVQPLSLQTYYHTQRPSQAVDQGPLPRTVFGCSANTRDFSTLALQKRFAGSKDVASDTSSTRYSHSLLALRPSKWQNLLVSQMISWLFRRSLLLLPKSCLTRGYVHRIKHSSSLFKLRALHSEAYSLAEQNP